MPKEPKLTKVVFLTQLSQDESPIVETVWAEQLGRSRYRLLNIPAFKSGISYGDVFEAKPRRSYSGRLCFTRVLEKSGNRTVRVVFKESIEASEFTKSAMDALSGLGCQYSGAAGTCFALNVPADRSLEEVIGYLESNDLMYLCADPIMEESEEAGPSS